MGEPAQSDVERDRVDRWMELAAAVVLGIAMLASAWSAYQASLWDGIQTFRLAAASSAGRKAESRAVIAGQQRGLDAASFQLYAAELTRGKKPAAEWVFKQFRPELQAATRAWLAGNPQQNPAAAGTPLDRPEYALAAEREAKELREAEASDFTAAGQANVVSDRYMLHTVGASVALFLGGITASFPRRGVRFSLLALSALVLAVVVLRLLQLPLAVE